MGIQRSRPRPYAGLVATEADVRRIALSLPETTEETWYRTPGYKVAGKGFLRLRTEAEGGLVVFVADLGEKQALLAQDHPAFFTTPHYDSYPDRAGQPRRPSILTSCAS